MHDTAWNLVGDYASENTPTWDISAPKSQQGRGLPNQVVESQCMPTDLDPEVWSKMFLPHLLQRASRGFRPLSLVLAKEFVALSVSVWCYGSTMCQLELSVQSSTPSQLSR